MAHQSTDILKITFPLLVDGGGFSPPRRAPQWGETWAPRASRLVLVPALTMIQCYIRFTAFSLIATTHYFFARKRVVCPLLQLFSEFSFFPVLQLSSPAVFSVAQHLLLLNDKCKPFFFFMLAIDIHSGVGTLELCKLSITIYLSILFESRRFIKHPVSVL